MPALMLRRLNASDAALNTATSVAPTARARSYPCSFGTSTGYATPWRRWMPVKTSAASASCGIHFGLTKLVASMLDRPVAVSRSISAILSAVATISFSFCRPSRGPTSTILTNSVTACPPDDGSASRRR